MKSWRCSARVHWGLGIIHDVLQMVEVLPLFSNIRRESLVSRARKPKRLKESDILEFGALPSTGRGGRGRWEGDQVLCRLC